MAKRRGEQVQTIQWPNEKGNKYRQYNDQTLFVCPLYCLYFFPSSFGHCVVCACSPFRSTDNTMTKRRGEQVQTIQWPNEKGNKYRQYNDQTKRGTSTDNTMAKRKGEQVQTCLHFSNVSLSTERFNINNPPKHFGKPRIFVGFVLLHLWFSM
jgi:hypothetical protein